MSSSARRPRKPSEAAPSLSSSVNCLPGIGTKRQEILQSLGIETIGDLILYPPTTYIDRKSFVRIAALRPGEIQTVVVRAVAFETKFIRGKRLSFLSVTDGSGKLRCLWFNQPYIENLFKLGSEYVFSGTVRPSKRGLYMVHPEYESAEDELLHTGRIVPVYRSRAGLSRRQLRALVKFAVDTYADQVVDHLPESMRLDLGLTPRGRAVRDIHFPPDLADAEAARRRLALDEMLLVQTLFALARKKKRGTGRISRAATSAIEKLASHLPFELTQSQAKALEDIVRDLTDPYPMRRLVQGDVGCGKTVVAALAMAAVCEAKGQVALLCPTEILAEQHYATISKYLEPFGFGVGLVLGGMIPAERLAGERALATGETKVAVGTHALIGERIRFKNLRLVVVDEEQRFGVLQRTKLVRDVPKANLLVLSATPIPRTLALTAYGDLDITVIGEMPPRRGRHTTRVIREEARAEALKEVAASINSGLRGFYVCPAVEETSADLIDVRTAKSEIEGLLRAGRGVEILTGKTRRDRRAKILKDFVADKIGLIVATTVVEVGMDIPSATLLVVDQAERFGLSQLHQMRGRVARADASSCSYFMVSDSASEKAWARLRILESTFDGFEIAEQDLVLRGPGDLGGTRQHGIPDLKFASLPKDLDLMLRARDEAFGAVLAKERSSEWAAWIAAVKSVADGKTSIV